MDGEEHKALATRRTLRRGRVVGTRILGAAILSLLLALPAAAQGLRDFSGQITSAGGQTIQVKNRQGDSLGFQRAPGTVVSGAKSSWEGLAVGDSVTVSWKLSDQPRVAHRVRVR
jgi:hypothetical protein